ncbi:subtilisin inhibitor-like [Actinomadura pelletieri DSM 43383]|uniref:Subtilisin inhibitor-like n=2 Tax=Actinomadura pelletieri TaxID=111805 RepID=A0A495QNC9_9ACTN|nr:subtilisin inhibitor-like [Actinomadura pelletieri DSM 43383]
MASVAIRLFMGLSLVVGGVAATAPAVAASTPPTSLTEIELTVTPQKGGKPRTATLTCEPAGGTHANAEVACAELAMVNGRIKDVPWRKGRLCLQYWEPVDATATGYWRGRPIEPYFGTVTNDGCARILHGHVLDF